MRRRRGPRRTAARRAAARPDLALVGQADLVALVDAGGIVTRSVRLRSVRPSPWQVWHGVSTILPSPWQRGQVVTLTIWPSIVWRTVRISPRPSHCGQVDGLGAGLGAAAGTVSQRLEDAELDLLLGALDRLLEGDPQVVAQVRARLRPAAPRRIRRRPRRRRTRRRCRRTRRSPSNPAPAPGSAVHPGPAEQVVALPSFRIGQDLVRLVDLLEPLLRARRRC